jgi:membrane protease YdiL (CAAX protease family)
MKQIIISNPVFRMWDHLPLIIRAVLSGFLVSSAGVFTWGMLFSVFPSPLVIIPMTIALWVFWKFFSGTWGTNRFAETRRNNFRLTSLQPATWKWGIAAAILFVVIVQTSFVVTFRLIAFPSAKFTADYKTLDTFPLWAAWVVLIMGSIVAGICEEAGFRGYMQVPLEKRYGPVIGITLTSIAFTLIHLGHTWATPILPHIFFASVLLGILAYKTQSLIPGIIGHSILDIFDYSVWWTDLTGGFTRQTIFKTGIDAHFIVFVLMFLSALPGFFIVIKKLSVGNNPASMRNNQLNLKHLTFFNKI